tara:strand:- start:248 stop:862 length:615 start_codon:yes stop_codon:yes gene_type:complete
MICVKPKDLQKLIKQLNKYIQKSNIIISFVAGIKTSSLKNFFSSKPLIVRFMPNLSIKYGESVTAVYSENLSVKEKKNLKIFSFFGILLWLKKEEEIDFFTAFFGGGPAYICYFFQCLQNMLEKKNIKKKVSIELIVTLFNGTINFIEKEKIEFKDLIKRVASKGGTTEKALKYFSQNNRFDSVITTAINKAENRSKELSKNQS